MDRLKFFLFVWFVGVAVWLGAFIMWIIAVVNSTELVNTWMWLLLQFIGILIMALTNVFKND